MVIPSEVHARIMEMIRAFLLGGFVCFGRNMLPLRYFAILL